MQLLPGNLAKASDLEGETPVYRPMTPCHPFCFQYDPSVHAHLHIEQFHCQHSNARGYKKKQMWLVNYNDSVTLETVGLTELFHCNLCLTIKMTE
jgi:hypothetical protein